MENKLKEYRKKKNLTQSQLADLVYVSKRTIISIEKVVYNPGLLLACRLAEALETELMILFYWRKIMNISFLK